MLLLKVVCYITMWLPLKVTFYVIVLFLEKSNARNLALLKIQTFCSALHNFPTKSLNVIVDFQALNFCP